VDFYAEELEGFPEVAYIALVGPFSEDVGDEILSRAQRIQEASPDKSILALDVRGITGLEADDFEILKDIHDRLQEMDWELCLCNTPSRLRDFFQSGRVQRHFHVYDKKQDLIDELTDEEEEPDQTDNNFEPVPVILRTKSGVRLFEGVASELEGTNLTVWTKDHNTKTVIDNESLDCNLYFNTDRIQVVPKEITIKRVDQVEHEEWNYQLTIELEEMDELDLEQIHEYFEQTPSSRT
jgi:anti-anti-sigma regulatory factor